MASRREFLQAGIAASLLPLSMGTSFKPAVSAAGDERPATPFYKVIFDRRFPASVAFANEMKRLGGPSHGINGDITDLWFHDLDVRWKKGPAAIAGLTAHGPFFCLERLAWDHGMRVVFRGEHTRLADGGMEHVLSGPANMLQEAADLSAGGSNWACRVANLVTRCPQGRSRASTRTVVSPSAEPAGDDTEPMFSWVIAPLVRA